MINPTFGVNAVEEILSQFQITPQPAQFESGHADPSRHLESTVKLFIKKLRTGNSTNEFRDLLNDTFCSRLGSLLGVPVPFQQPVFLDGLGLVLVSPHCGTRTIAGLAKEQIANAGDLGRTMVFEELIMNTDDKIDHYRAKPIADGRFRYSVADHGHSLHGWKPNLRDPAAIENDPSVRRSAFSGNLHFIASSSELAPAIEEIQSHLTEAQEIATARTYASLAEARDPGLATFLERWETESAMINRILELRVQNLTSIITERCQKSGIPIDLAPKVAGAT